MDILVARDIVKRFNTFTALDRVSITVPEQCVFGLLGPNGAGKTTLIRIINHITGPDSGEVLFEGRPSLSSDVEKIGYLPEERGLYKKMEVGEQCLYLAQLKGLSRQEARKRLKDWFERFEMGSWWKKKVEELSKGMQQKVQFVATVIHEPKVLILDEPFSGFDPINANLIKNEILELKKKGSTILLSTHNMNSVEELCDHIALINQARTILEGSVKEIRKQYRSNTFEVEFKGNMLALATGLWAGYEVVDHSSDGDSVKARIKILRDNTPNQLLQAILPVVEVHGFREILPSMNDIFIAKVKNSELAATPHLTE